MELAGPCVTVAPVLGRAEFCQFPVGDCLAGCPAVDHAGRSGARRHSCGLPFSFHFLQGFELPAGPPVDGARRAFQRCDVAVDIVCIDPAVGQPFREPSGSSISSSQVPGLSSGDRPPPKTRSAVRATLRERRPGKFRLGVRKTAVDRECPVSLRESLAIMPKKKGGARIGDLRRAR